jgi:predicted RNA-binding Zn-ribbon protein involved in translation (DUF1610 family)
MNPREMLVFCASCGWKSKPLSEDAADIQIDFDCPKCGADSLDARTLNEKEKQAQ